MADSDQLYQDAINQISGVATPDVNTMKLKLGRLVQQGLITPQQMQAALVDKNAYNDIVTNPAYTGAQQNALTQMQEISSDGGMTPMDKAQLGDIESELNTTERGREGAIMQNARERGVGGSGLEMAARLQDEQSGADRASRAGLDVAAQAQQRAMAAMQESGKMATDLRGQDFQEGAAKAGAQNAIDAANAQMTNQTRAYNTSAANNAAAANLGEKQRVSDTNVGLGNEESTHDSSLPELDFQNKMGKANAVASIYDQWGGAAAKERSEKRAFQNARDAKLIQGGAQLAGSAIGGPAGGAAAGGETAPAGYNPNMAPGQTARLGYSKGGVIPGHAPFKGDNPANDTVPARLSPGEMVIPRSVTENPHLLPDFIKHMRGTPTAAPKMKEIDHTDIAKVFKALSSMKEGN